MRIFIEVDHLEEHAKSNSNDFQIYNTYREGDAYTERTHIYRNEILNKRTRGAALQNDDIVARQRGDTFHLFF